MFSKNYCLLHWLQQTLQQVVQRNLAASQPRNLRLHAIQMLAKGDNYIEIACSATYMKRAVQHGRAAPCCAAEICCVFCCTSKTNFIVADGLLLI
jgi:hypothetical protein